MNLARIRWSIPLFFGKMTEVFKFVETKKDLEWSFKFQEHFFWDTLVYLYWWLDNFLTHPNLEIKDPWRKLKIKLSKYSTKSQSLILLGTHYLLVFGGRNCISITILSLPLWQIYCRWEEVSPVRRREVIKHMNNAYGESKSVVIIWK